MHRRLLLISIFALTVFGFLFQTTTYAKLVENQTTQGEFALWLLKEAGAMNQISPSANGSDAINFLKIIGVIPENGWKADEPINKQFLASLLGLSEQETTEKSNKPDGFQELVDSVVQLVENRFNSAATGVSSADNSASSSSPS